MLCVPFSSDICFSGRVADNRVVAQSWVAFARASITICQGHSSPAGGEAVGEDIRGVVAGTRLEVTLMDLLPERTF